MKTIPCLAVLVLLTAPALAMGWWVEAGTNKGVKDPTARHYNGRLSLQDKNGFFGPTLGSQPGKKVRIGLHFGVDVHLWRRIYLHPLVETNVGVNERTNDDRPYIGTSCLLRYWRILLGPTIGYQLDPDQTRLGLDIGFRVK